MDRHRIFRRGKVWYLQNDTTGKQTSLHTRDKREAHPVEASRLFPIHWLEMIFQSDTSRT